MERVQRGQILSQPGNCPVKVYEVRPRAISIFCLSNPSYSLCRFLVSYRSQCLGNPSYSLCQFLFYEPRWCGCAGRQCLRIDQASDQSKSSCPALHRPWNSRFSENQRAHKLFGDTTPRNEESKNVSTELSKGIWPKEIETGGDLVFMRRSFNKSPAQQREVTWSNYPLDNFAVYIFLCCGWGPDISPLRQKLGSILMW